jgi:hypothetical protein
LRSPTQCAGLDWKQIFTWAGHSGVRQTWNRHGHLLPGGEQAAAAGIDAYLNFGNAISTVAHNVAHPSANEKTPENPDVVKYRYRDSNPGFRRERAAS